MAQYVLMCR